MPIIDRAQLSEKRVPIIAITFIVYVWSMEKFTEIGGQINGRSIEAHPPAFDFARFLDAIEGYIYHSLGCK